MIFVLFLRLDSLIPLALRPSVYLLRTFIPPLILRLAIHSLFLSVLTVHTHVLSRTFPFVSPFSAHLQRTDVPLTSI